MTKNQKKLVDNLDTIGVILLLLILAPIEPRASYLILAYFVSVGALEFWFKRKEG